mgnify:CR=1 FL=1
MLRTHEINLIAKRRIRNLAVSLAHLANVSEGRQLVALIGNGDEHSNIEALQTWVTFELKHCELSEENKLDYLYARLFMVLSDYTL